MMKCFDIRLVLLCCLSLLESASTDTTNTGNTKPHIIFIMSDDMGFDDISFHGSDQIPTPNIDALLSYGIALQRYYTEPLCTPSRSALMTGKYASNLGMQHSVILNPQPWGLPLEEKILPQYMKEAGYATHIIGKWHLGLYTSSLSPVNRGFDSFYGYLGGAVEYFNHGGATLYQDTGENVYGYDWRKNLNITYDAFGVYATDVFTRLAIETIHNHNQDIPLFLYLSHLAPHAGNSFDTNPAPEEEIAKFDYIRNVQRRGYAAKVSILDDSVGRVVKVLNEAGMIENAIIVFVSDNGSPITGVFSNGGSNYPFRGDSFWDGAVHNIGGIWSPLLQNKQRTSSQLMHIADWLPTFGHIAGFEVPPGIDGKNMWDALSFNEDSPRTELLVNVDPTYYTSLISGKWKYINCSTHEGVSDEWLSDDNDRSERNPLLKNYGETVVSSVAGKVLAQYSSEGLALTGYDVEELRSQAVITCNNVPMPPVDSRHQCDPAQSPCLFDIVNDPCERQNVATEYPEVFSEMTGRAAQFNRIALPPRQTPEDPRSSPKYYNETWTYWFDELGADADPLDLIGTCNWLGMDTFLTKYFHLLAKSFTRPQPTTTGSLK